MKSDKYYFESKKNEKSKCPVCNGAKKIMVTDEKITDLSYTKFKLIDCEWCSGKKKKSKD